MGYSHVTDLNLSHNSFNNAKSKPPLMPKPNYSACSLPNAAIISPCHGCPNSTILLALNHEINSNERSKAEFSHEQQPLGSSRWNPTPEQLLVLEELYRRGTRTPSAAQIQQIATRLRRFGKIEGKNVFYWFQNHKARERQKRCRELETEPPPQQQEQRQRQYGTEKSFQKKESVFSLSIIEETKKKGPPSNFSTLSEVKGSKRKSRKEKPNKRIDQQGYESAVVNICWEKKSSKKLHSLLSVGAVVIKGPEFFRTCEFISTQRWMQIKEKQLQQRSAVGKVLNNKNLCSFKTHQGNNITNLEDENRDDQTLELFPLDRNGINISKKGTTQVPIRAINTNFKPNQYFEFLPLKN